jgi:hypothetical protein
MATVRSKIGDVIEIKTRRGLAYAQYTNEAELHGSVIRVFDRLYEKRPDNLKSLPNQAVRFATFFPIAAAVKNEMVKKVGNFEVAPENKKFPLFRYGVPNPCSGKVEEWSIWDGKQYRKIENITEVERKLPILWVLDVTSLTELIEENWRPENDLV